MRDSRLIDSLAELKKIADSKTITIVYRTDAIPFSFRDGEIASNFNKWFGAVGEPTGLTRAMFVFGSLRE